MSSTPDKYDVKNNIHSTILLSVKGILLAAILPILFGRAWADQTAHPIQISADNAQNNDSLGQTIYRGNVIVEQGSLFLKGDKVIINVQTFWDGHTPPDRVIEAML